MGVAWGTAKAHRGLLESVAATFRDAKREETTEWLNGARLAALGAGLELLADPERRKKANPHQLSVMFGVYDERWRLDLGLATSHHEVHVLRGELRSRDDLVRRLKDLGILDVVVEPPADQP